MLPYILPIAVIALVVFWSAVKDAQEGEGQ